MGTNGAEIDIQSRLAALFGGPANSAAELAQQLNPGIPEDWRRVAAQLAVLESGCSGEVTIFGLCGGQGAGKSTLARAMVAALMRRGIRAATVSLDDFYYTHEQRQRLAREVHPLLATRGVPGTHDLALVDQTFATLAESQVRLPRFDKAADDRLPRTAWQTITGPLQVLIFEGWCIGATPQSDAALATPVNALEADEDPEGHYRRYVNDALASDYAALWQWLDRWLYLAVPDMAAVTRWRAEQEAQLAPSARMPAAALTRFVAHYERLTRWQAQTAPDLADWCLRLGPDHRLQL